MINQNNRLTIGLLNFGVSDPNSLNIWQGVFEVAQENGINLICFPANPVGSKYGFDYQANVLYDLVSHEIIDGLVFWGTMVTHYNNPEDMKDFPLRFGKIPLTSISMKFDGIPTIDVKGYQGMRFLVEHLITVHGFRRIAFIRGPVTHLDADARYHAYMDTLKENGIPYDEKLVVPGDFRRPSGENAVKYFLDELQTLPEAIVAVNDVTAIDAIISLRNRNIVVPKDVSVVGFDDIGECEAMTPPLTTVSQSLYRQGKKAAECLIQLLKKEEVPMELVLPLQLIVRQSCGCKNATILNAKAAHHPVDSLPSRSSEDISNSIIKNIGALSIQKGQIESLVESFVNDVLILNNDSFLSQLDNTLQKMSVKTGSISFWHDVLSKLRCHCLPYLKSDQLFHAENMINQARVMISEHSYQTEGVNRMIMELQNQKIIEFSQDLVSSNNVSDIMKLIVKKLPELGINSFYLSLYENPGNPIDWSRLILAFDDDGIQYMDPAGIRFPTRKLLPDGMIKNNKIFNLVIEPLYFRESQIGLALFDSQPEQGKIYDLIRVLLSSALQGAMLVQKIELHLAEIRLSKIELEKTYTDLKNNQENLLATEKMASLGRLTSGIAHEMNTPLAAVRASLSELNNLVIEYRQSISNPGVLPDDHLAIAGDMNKQIDIAVKSAEKSAGFIRGIKGQTIGLNSQPHLIFQAAPVIRDSLTLLEFYIRKGKCTLTIDTDEDSTIFGDQREISQIVINLVNNAVDACAPDGGTIAVRLKKNMEGGAVLRVEDSGCGILPENLSRIFDPMFTTKPFGTGTGLGLTLVHDMVKKNNGKLTVESSIGRTVFQIIFPIAEFL
jgi:DNA-binding LacI/PurR family transcriptional regulator/signal transduction histidine kinase